MPFTPFHFGLGLAAKASAPRHFYLVYFVALQVAIDLESLYNLVQERHPVHRFLHTFVGATLLAVASTLALAVFLSIFQRRAVPGSHRFAWLLATALFAAWSHVVLDGIMHRDARPFRPFTDRNPMLSIIGVGPLHLACVLLGIYGLIGLAFRFTPRDSPG